MSASVKHSIASVEWYTPPDVVELCRAALGGFIELDPASCDAAQTIVQARRYCTIEKPCEDWDAATIFCNPPNPPMPWWAHCEHARTIYGSRVAFVCYSLEQLSQIARLGYPRGAVVCIPPKRLRYYATARDLAAKARSAAFRASDTKRNAALVARVERLEALPPDSLHPGDAPPHASAIVLLGGDSGPLVRAGWAVMAVQS
jgi:hypothetical protein